MRGEQISVELLKAFRGRWLTVEEASAELEITEGAGKVWVTEWHAQGLLEHRRGTRRFAPRGVPPAEFTLSARWIGGTR